MDTILNKNKEKRQVNKAFIAGIIVAIAAIAAAVYLLSFTPPMEVQMAKILEGSHREGSPEFDQLTRDIVISTDNNTIESPTAFGTISMYIKGRIRNKGDQTLDGLEVNVAVVDQFNQVLKEKRILVVPVQRSQLGPGEIIPITLTLDGFSKADDRANIRWKVTAIRSRINTK
ncbi:MAG: hypothetical protein WBD22_03845 [Pyrinomonadaceae bacterium]